MKRRPAAASDDTLALTDAEEFSVSSAQAEAYKVEAEEFFAWAGRLARFGV